MTIQSENINQFKGLTQQTQAVFMCVDFPIRDGLFNLSAYNLDDLYESLSTSCFLFAFRIHDKDIKESGELKTPHIHIFIRAPKRHQLKYFLYLVADILHANESLISVKPAESDAGCIQYLIHKRNPEKFQYSKDLIMHNYNNEVFEELMSQDVITNISSKELIEYCKKYSRLELLEVLGVSRYNLYSKTIDMIYKEYRYLHTRELISNKRNIKNNT